MQELFVAKTGENHKWLPLSQHLEDTANTMRYLCDKYVALSICAAAGLLPDDFMSLCIFCAAVHDIGKATPAFQGKILSSAMENRDIRHYGFSVVLPDSRAEMSPHALAGAVILNQFFSVDESICDIIAGHHGIPRRSGKETKLSYQLKRFTRNFYGEDDEEVYKAVWEEIYRRGLEYAGIKALPDKSLSVQAQMLITGLVIMADWIASNEEYFPLFDSQTSEPSVERLQFAEKRLHLPPAWMPEYARLDDSIFKMHFGFAPNAVQKCVVEIASELDAPGILIIEAPMGVGKTEAALAAAEVFSYAAGSGGIFFGLPTQGTANGIFPRMLDWAKSVSENMVVSVNLAHGDAGANTVFASYKARVDDEEGIQINAWMLGRHRTLLPDFVTGTIDQALMAALKKKFVMLLHLGLVGKTVIIDEVHSYDTYMSVFMKCLLAWFGIYKVPVILLSATLTGRKRNELLSAYCRHEVEIKSDAYPLISFANSREESFIEIAEDEILARKVEIQYAKEEEMEAVLGENMQNGGCAGVIIDTVGGAQKVWEKLKTAFPDWRVVLLHSRFLPDDRTRIENRILDLVGKNSRDRDRIIVVGTQVLEQSLDLDFDMLITDKCPVDLLFQRLGRLHRHNGHNSLRPERLRKAKCYILNDEDSCKRASMPYSQYILRRTDEMLEKYHFLNIPADIRSMTDQVYNLDMGSDGEDKKRYTETLKGMEVLAEQWCIPNPAGNACEFRGLLDEALDGVGSVRYGINNMEFILLKDVGDAFETFSGEKISKWRNPSPRQITEIMHQTISMRYNEKLYLEMETRKKKIFVKWMNESVFLDSTFAIMDKEGVIVIGEEKYSYSPNYGWRKET